MRRLSFLLAAATISVGLTSNVSAVPVTFEFEGIIDFYRVITADPFEGKISVGSPFRGRYTFETTTTNEGTSESGIYVHRDSQFGIDVQIGELSGNSLTALLPLHYRIILNDGHVQDIQSQSMIFGGVNAYLAQIFLKDPTSTALSSVELSLTPPDLSDYQIHTFFLGIGPPTNATDIMYSGQITSIRQVPEPSSLSLIAVAALVLLVTLRPNRTLKTDPLQAVFARL